MALDEPKDDESVKRIDGLEFLLDAQVEPYTAGQLLDFVQSWRGEGFSIRPAGGGCG